METLKEELKEDIAIKERKEKLTKVFHNKHNLYFLAILIFSLVILLYYFNLTKNQTLWYDEAEYLSTAKHWAFGVPYEINPQRPPLFPFLAVLLYKIGFGEVLLKFFLSTFPLFLIVFFTYFLIKEMYDKKIALIAAFITSVSWIHLFYSMRIMTDMLGLLFGLLSFLFFWKGYVKENKNEKYLLLVGFFIGLSFLLRLTGILYGAVLVLFLLFTDNFKFLKNKYIWSIPFIFILTITPYLVWSYNYYGDAFAFRAGYVGPPVQTLGWPMINFVYDYLEPGFFIFFLIGLVSLVPMILSLDRIIMKKDKTFLNDFFMFLSVVFILFFFIYFLRQGENRWLILMSIGLFTISAKGIMFIFNSVKKSLGRSLAIILLIIILFSGAYFQLKQADLLIKNKIDTYTPVKEAALWMKDNSNQSDLIVTSSMTQNVYYSERKTISFYDSVRGQYYTPEEFDQVILKERPKFLVISVFEPSVPQWTYSYPDTNKTRFQPVKVWFADKEQKQPTLVIYEVKY